MRFMSKVEHKNYFRICKSVSGFQKFIHFPVIVALKPKSSQFLPYKGRFVK
jgi:hypothetical protein